MWVFLGERLDWGEQGSTRDPVRQKPPCRPTEVNTVDVSAARPRSRRLLQWPETAETAPAGELAEKSAHGIERLWGRRTRKHDTPDRITTPERLLVGVYK